MTAPHGLDDIIATFGDCHAASYEQEHIVSFELPYPLVYGSAMVRKTRCHRLLAPIFRAVFEDIKAADLVERATHYGGIFAQRAIRGLPRFPSTHSWGIALDLNPAENPLGKVGHQDSRVVAIFKKYGFTWGGEFKSRLDPMHFQFCSNY